MGCFNLGFGFPLAYKQRLYSAACEITSELLMIFFTSVSQFIDLKGVVVVFFFFSF